MTKDDTKDQKRRTILQKTGAAVAAGAILPGAANAKPGNGNGPGKGKGNGHGHGDGPGQEGGPGGEGHGPDGDGPPGKKFAEPDTNHIVFCGCSQVCVCYAGCGKAVVLVEGGDRIEMDADDPSKPDIPGCVEVDEGRIVGVQDTGYSESSVICNPNLACGSFEDGEYSLPKEGCDGKDNGSNNYEQESCYYGTAPQFGARCGDAFIRECSTTGKHPE